MNGRSSFFDSRAKDWEKNCYPPEVRVRLDALIPEFRVESGATVLDIGTGPGILLPYLKKRVGNGGRLCAFDISFEMVKEAVKKPMGYSDGVFQADVHFMPFRSGVFDHVICFAAFPHFSDPKTALAEMSRTAKHGGSVVIAHLLSREELAKHHGNHHAVKKDVLPDKEKMTDLFLEAGLEKPYITDVPGRYLAFGLKR